MRRVWRWLMGVFWSFPRASLATGAGSELENKKAGQWFTEIQRSRKRDLLPLGSPDAPDKDLEPGSWTQTHCSAKCLLARFVGWARESCSPVIHRQEGEEGLIYKEGRKEGKTESDMIFSHGFTQMSTDSERTCLAGKIWGNKN
jgi:hypothetical protein